MNPYKSLLDPIVRPDEFVLADGWTIVGFRHAPVYTLYSVDDVREIHAWLGRWLAKYEQTRSVIEDAGSSVPGEKVPESRPAQGCS